MQETSEVKVGIFLNRPNRFLCEVEIDGTIECCHLPNPGRMWELLFPRVRMYVRRSGQKNRRTAYDVIGVEREGIPILLDTQYTNEVAARLIQEKKIPAWKDWQVLRREVAVGHSRFDLLLGRGPERFYVEVKSCTLFGRHGAMFPDAVTERGKKHLLTLAAMREEGIRTGILFLVQWDRARWFLPDYHTDPAFASVFFNVAPRLDWQAFSVHWTPTFQMPEPAGTLFYPAQVLDKENHDSGVYLVILQVERSIRIEIGAMGERIFPAGYYVYIGSAKKHLTARLERHKRLRKKMHWHIDYLRQQAKVTATVPIRTSAPLEHSLAAAVQAVSEGSVPGFGCTDCSCRSHLFMFSQNPLQQREFVQVIEDFRINRLEVLIE